MGVFLLCAWLSSYRTIRERIGLAHQSGPQCRKERDFFDYSQRDVHYFSNWFTIFAMTTVASSRILFLRQYGYYKVRFGFGLALVIHLIYARLIRRVFFSRELILNASAIDKLTVVSTFILSFLMFFAASGYIQDQPSRPYQFPASKAEACSPDGKFN